MTCPDFCADGQDSAHLDDQSPSGQSILAGNREDSASGAGSSRQPGDAPHPPAEGQRPTPEDARSILSEAESLVYGDRNHDYGDPWEDYGRTVAIFNAMTGRDLTAEEGIRFMVAVKLSRMAVSPGKRDHAVDAAGYLDCWWQTVNHDPKGEQ